MKRKELILPVNVAGIEFKNPFYVASGPTTKSMAQLRRIYECGWAGASIKLTIDPVPYVNRKPRYALFHDRDALCFTTEKRLKTEEGLRLMEEGKKELKDLILMANITYAGDGGVEGWVNLAKQFESVGADIIELNMCCPNMSFNLELTKGSDSASTKHTGASLGQHGDAVAEIVRAIKKEVKIPVFVKLTPEGGKIAQVAKTLMAAGADAVGGTSNRMAMPPINLENPAKSPFHLMEEISMACHCSTYIKPLALRDTYEMRNVCGPDLRIMQAGGVRKWEDAIEHVMCGADLLGISSETLISGYDFLEDIVVGMQNYLKEHGHKSLSEIRDAVVPHVRTAADVTIYDGYAHIKDNRLAGPCKDACPAHVPAQAYVKKVAKRDFKGAYESIMGAGPLQSLCGEICNHKCEEACSRGVIGEAIRIRELKRFVLDYAEKQGWSYELNPAAKNGKSVAVVGSGPAGIAAAYELALAGYDVTVFEKEEKTGGMLRYCIPDFRLDKSLIDKEIARLTKLGVKIECGRALGRDFTVDSLRKEYAAVVLAIGAQKGKALHVENEDAAGVYPAVDYLKDVYNGKITSASGTVVVIGGGFTAVDSARTAKRLGAEKVYIAYRRTKDEMPATREEVAEAEAEGVKIMYLVSPVEIGASGGKVTGIRLCNQVLDVEDASGRRKPEAVDGAMFDLSCTTVIAATGQEVDAAAGVGNGRGWIEVDAKFAAGEGVFAAGDAVEVDSVIAAVAMGKKAAKAADEYVGGGASAINAPEQLQRVDPIKVIERNGFFTDGEPISLEVRSGEERVHDFKPYTRVFTEEEAVAEASRCLGCGCGEGCSICKDICSEFAIHSDGPDRVAIHEDECVACGMCYNRCPNGNIEMINRGTTV